MSPPPPPYRCFQQVRGGGAPVCTHSCPPPIRRPVCMQMSGVGVQAGSPAGSAPVLVGRPCTMSSFYLSHNAAAPIHSLYITVLLDWRIGAEDLMSFISERRAAHLPRSQTSPPPAAAGRHFTPAGGVHFSTDMSPGSRGGSDTEEERRVRSDTQSWI